MIAILAHTHPSITAGGAEISAYTLYRGLRELGLPACFVAMCPHAAIDRVRLDTPDEHVVGYDPADYETWYHLADREVTAELHALLERLGCDRVVFHHFLNFGANTVRDIARAWPGRTWLVLHEFLAICHHHGQMVTRPALRLCAAASPGACATCFDDRDAAQFVVRRDNFLEAFAPLAGFVSPSRFLKERFVAWGLPAASIAVIENGVPRLPAPESAPHDDVAPMPGDADDDEDRDVAGDAITVGFFGQINPFKGVDLLLDAAELVARRKGLAKRLRLRVHGHLVGQSTAFTERFREAVARHPFLQAMGPYANDRVFDLMRECDYVLMASQWWENSPVVIQEAYACGRPLVVPALGGMKEKIVDGVTGLHFRPGDAADLVRVLERAARPGVRERLRERLPPVATGADMAREYLSMMGGEAPRVAPAVLPPLLPSVLPPDRAAPVAALLSRPPRRPTGADHPLPPVPHGAPT